MATTSAPAVGFDDWQWPPPKDWQKLERICHILWRRIWNDPNALLHGRPGQQQHGVDVYGTPKGETGVHGVQCKRKDVLLNTLISKEEVRTEVQNAKAFHPPLVELIIATCAPSDADLQALARQITEEHAQQGLFRVHIYGWTDILARMAEYPEVISQIYGSKPIAEPSSDPAVVREAHARHTELVSGQVAIQRQLAELTSKLVAPANDGPAHAKLDLCRDLLEAHSYRAALPLLERIRAQEWVGANDALRFRIATNLGAAHLGLGKTKEAGEYFLQAFEFDHESDKALTNRAFGLFLLDRRNEALTAAREGIEKHPLSSRTWSVYLNVMSRVEPESPVPDIPQALANDPHVLFVRADALALRGLWSEAEGVLRQLIALPRSDVMAKSRLAEVILAQVTGGRFYAGAQYSATDMACLGEARALLEETWNAIKRTDLAAGALHVIQNWCALCAVLGQVHQAEEGVDEALAIAPEAPDLIVWKIRMAASRGDGETALRLLAKLPANAVDEYATIAAAAYAASNDAGHAAGVLEKYIHSSNDPEVSNDARCMFADLVCESDLAHAEARFNALAKAGSPQVARSTLIFARGLRKVGVAEAAGRYLALAREQLATSAITRDRLMLADALAEFEDHEGAVAIYEKELSTATDTPSLREYFRCLLELDQRRRLTTLLASLPIGLSKQPSYEFTRANLALRSGDFAAARAALERCIAIGPERLVTRLMWADVCVRLDDPQPAKAWLDTIDVRSTVWALDRLLRLGPLYHALGQAEGAAAAFYEALRRFPHDPRAHLAFCASVLFKGSDAWTPKANAIAGRDMAVKLRDPDGREQEYILV